MAEGSIEQVLAGTASWNITRGDSLVALRSLPDECVDLLLTDPPYSSGGQFRGDRARSTGEKYVTSGAQHVPDDFEGDTRDQRAYELWTSIWCAEAWRVAKDGAIGVLFTDWRQLGATADAFQAGGWVFRGIAPWDKTESTRPRAGGFRGQCEYMVWGTRGALIERDVYLNGCFRVPVGRDKLHQAVKPDALLAELVRLCPGGGRRTRSVPGLRKYRTSSHSSWPSVHRFRDRRVVGGVVARTAPRRRGWINARGEIGGTGGAFRMSPLTLRHLYQFARDNALDVEVLIKGETPR